MSSEGVTWTPAHKDSRSRQNGWELLRERLKNMMKLEGPRLFGFNTCRQFIRTVPALPRDEIDRDDVDRMAEDHVGMLGFALGTKGIKSVPRPPRALLSLRNTGHWNHEIVFESAVWWE